MVHARKEKMVLMDASCSSMIEGENLILSATRVDSVWMIGSKKLTCGVMTWRLRFGASLRRNLSSSKTWPNRWNELDRLTEACSEQARSLALHS